MRLKQAAKIPDSWCLCGSLSHLCASSSMPQNLVVEEDIYILDYVNIRWFITNCLIPSKIFLILELITHELVNDVLELVQYLVLCWHFLFGFSPSPFALIHERCKKEKTSLQL